jgi:hypothetical protein
MPTLSTLSEIHLTLLNFVRSSFTIGYPTLFVDNYQFAFSPADDEQSDFRRLEEVRKDLSGPSNQVVLPSVVISFLGVDSVWRQRSGRLSWGVTSTGVSVGGSRGTVIDLNYSIKGYCRSFDECSLISELFLLYLADIRKVTYTSQQLSGQQLDINLEYEMTQITRVSDLNDRWNGRGHIYKATTEVKVTGTIVLTAIEIYKRILKTSQTPFHIGLDAETQYEYVPPDYHDRFTDTISSSDTIE